MCVTECVDLPLWVDMNENTCIDFFDEWDCFDSIVESNQLTAAQACCVCGGGDGARRKVAC